MKRSIEMSDMDNHIEDSGEGFQKEMNVDEFDSDEMGAEDFNEASLAEISAMHEREELVPDQGNMMAVEDGDEDVDPQAAAEIEESELAQFESAEIEEEEFIPLEQMESILESLLFVSDRPLSMAAIKEVFKGTNITTRQIRKAMEALAVEYASAHRGVTLESVSGGYQLRTKVDNMSYLQRMVKARPFKLSGPAMEVLAIVAYKQPLVKAAIDEIRGVESGHLLRALMEKGIVCFAGKSDLPGKPMLYATTRKFLEIFSLKSVKELPALNEIDELLPEGIGGEEEEKQTLSDLTDNLSEEVTSTTYSDGETELLKITDQLAGIDTSSEFFEQEKQRQKEKRDRERAQDLQEALNVGEEVDPRDQRWLERYLAKQEELARQEAEEQAASEKASEPITEALPEDSTTADELAAAEEEVGGETVPDLDPMIDGADKLIRTEALEAMRAFDEDDAERIIPIDDPSAEAMEDVSDFLSEASAVDVADESLEMSVEEGSDSSSADR